MDEVVELAMERSVFTGGTAVDEPEPDAAKKEPPAGGGDVYAH